MTPRVDGQADLQVFPSQVTPWFHMSKSRKPTSLNEDVGTHGLCLKAKRGMFGVPSTTENDDHSHSVFKEDKSL